MISESILKCPSCGAQQKEEMPENTCQFSYRCNACKHVIKTTKGNVVSIVVTVTTHVHKHNLLALLAVVLTN